MKLLKSILFSLPLLIMGCGNDPSTQIVGTWKSKTQGLNSTMTFTEYSWYENSSKPIPAEYTFEDHGNIGVWYEDQIQAYLKVEGNILLFRSAIGNPHVAKYTKVTQ